MDTATYPDPAVAAVLAECAVPVRIDVFKDRERAKAHRAIWTPMTVFLDADGREHHRALGFHPPRDFAALVLLASGLASFAGGKTDAALPRFDRIAAEFADTESAPEAIYFRGVCRFKRSKDTRPIYDACREIVERYPNHFWAKKIGFVTRYRDFNAAP
jgi:hypothetical protein